MSQKRIELEQSATSIVQKSGLSKLSFRTLADEVGVKSSSVHYYFPEKADLANSIIQNYTDEMTNRLASIDNKNATAQKKLLAFVKIFEEVAQQDKFCLCGMMAAEVQSLSEQNKSALNRYFSAIEDWLANVIKQADLRVDLTPKVLAHTILSGLEGALLIDRAGSTRSRLKAQKELIKTLIA